MLRGRHNDGRVIDLQPLFLTKRATDAVKNVSSL